MKASHWKIEIVFGTLGATILLGFALFYFLIARPVGIAAARVDTYSSLEESVAAYKKNPNDSVALRSLADYYSLRRDYTKAVLYFQRAVNADPDNTYNKFSLGIALKEAGRREESIRVLEEVAATGGNNPEKEVAGKIAQKMKSNPNWDTPAPGATLQLAPHHHGT